MNGSVISMRMYILMWSLKKVFENGVMPCDLIFIHFLSAFWRVNESV